MRPLLQIPAAILIVLTAARCEAESLLVEHDWTVTIGESEFGLRQMQWSRSGRHDTFIYTGRSQPRVQVKGVRVWTVVAVMMGTIIVGASVIGTFAVKAFGKRGGEPTKAPQKQSPR